MPRNEKPFSYRFFVGDRPLDELTTEEQKEFGEKVTQRMGNALNDYFSQHPEEYKKI